MDLSAYLSRIGFEQTPRADLATLIAIHRAHVLAIPYENLDVQLGRSLDLDIHRIYDKIIERSRGGWCYEMNGIFAWALEEIGFELWRMVGGVNRAQTGDEALGNHLVLCVQLDEPWIADVGLGDGTFEPYPLKPHGFVQEGFDYELEKRSDCWRFHNNKFSNASSMDFYTQVADESLLAMKSHSQSTAPDSSFVKNLVCQRCIAGGYELQIGRVAKRLSPDGDTERLIDSADELVESLRQRFNLDVPEIAVLWDDIMARHEEVLSGNR